MTLEEIKKRGVLKRTEELLSSPIRLMYTLLICVFLIETLVMVVLEGQEPVGWKETLIDSTILTSTLFLILYYTLFKPLVILVNDYRVTENQLKAHKEQLEQKVMDRTSELHTAYLDLMAENADNIRNKAALRESEDRFRQLFEQSEDAIVLISPQDFAIVDVNPAAEMVFRKQRSEMLGGGLFVLCDPIGCKQLELVLNQIIQYGSPGMIEKFECKLSSGEPHVLSFHGKRIPLLGAEIVYTTFRDITVRVHLEEQAQEIQARLIHANRMTTLGTMVSSVAHEINNPNNFLLMNAGIIKQAWSDIAPVVEERFEREGDFAVARSTWSEARVFLPEAIEGIQQGALRISDIIDSLKSYGRDDRFKCGAVADVNAVVQLSASILSQHISTSTHRFTLDLVDGLPPVRGSARQLEQVVINLVQNALQALPDADRGVRVETGIDRESCHVLIRVSDEGNGIPPEIAARVMEPFFTTRLERGGTGLGLAISQTIVKEHGGTIEFHSEPDVGTTFTVRLLQAAPPENETLDSEGNRNGK